MGYPRNQLVTPGVPGTFHCVSRCVRRAFLCGKDALTGRCFDHRRDWIEARLLELAETFSLSVLAYSVMSNHLHVVLHVDPGHVAGWSDEEVATRWVRLFPVRICGEVDAQACRRKTTILVGNAERIVQLRQRLADVSWFMRCLSEPLARRANTEDRCTGRFWEGRFRCQALLDDEAVLACMTYVDLNPVRAGVAQDLTTSLHTSIRLRLSHEHAEQANPLRAAAGPPAAGFLPISEADYVDLVDWTCRQLHAGKRSSDPPDWRPWSCPGKDASAWLGKVAAIETRFCRAVGSAQSLHEKAREIGQRWLMVRRRDRARP